MTEPEDQARSVDFIDFARSEGRFSKHFDKDGNPSETLLVAKQDRLENWHVLQELAGLILRQVLPITRGSHRRRTADARPGRHAGVLAILGRRPGLTSTVFPRGHPGEPSPEGCSSGSRHSEGPESCTSSPSTDRRRHLTYPNEVLVLLRIPAHPRRGGPRRHGHLACWTHGSGTEPFAVIEHPRRLSDHTDLGHGLAVAGPYTSCGI